MYLLKKTFEIAIAHHLNLDYDSPCLRCHGHNLKLTIYCASKELNKNKMVIDFTEIKKKIKNKLDHRDLNKVEEVGFERYANTDSPSETSDVLKNPTAERLAEWICHQFSECYRVDVQESEGNTATYLDDSMQQFNL